MHVTIKPLIECGNVYAAYHTAAGSYPDKTIKCLLVVNQKPPHVLGLQTLAGWLFTVCPIDRSGGYLPCMAALQIAVLLPSAG